MSTFDGVIREYPSIVVDRFIAHRDGAHHHFLSHAHADHMVGLPCKKWPSSMPIYCSVGTARVLRGLGGGRYRSMLRHLRPLPLDTPFPLTKHGDSNHEITVTLLDANHCPGSVMFLFQGHAGNVLYTGDVRAEPVFIDSLRRHPRLRSASGGGHFLAIDTLYLDTTFCHEAYRYFPARHTATEQIIDIIRQYSTRTAVYLELSATIGYEQLLLALSAAFQCKIHVSSQLLSVYTAASSSSSSSVVTPDNPSAATPAPRKTLFDAVRACLTDTLDEPCRIHACGNKPRFANPDDAHPTIMPCCPELGTDFVRIRPAAYWFSGRAEVDEVDVEHRAAYHKVAYSMHSSLSELQSLVQMLHPTRIFPTVYRVPASLGGKRNTAHNYRLHDILASLAGVSEDISAVKKRAAYFQAKRARIDEWRAKIRRGDCIPMTQCVAEGRSLLTAPFDEM